MNIKSKKTPTELLKEKIYHIEVSSNVATKKDKFNLEEFRKQAKEVKKTFRNNEHSILCEPYL